MASENGKDAIEALRAQYLMGDKFTVPDAYCFTVTGWTKYKDIDLGRWPHLKAYMDRVGSRPKVQEALKAEGLVQQPVRRPSTPDRTNGRGSS